MIQRIRCRACSFWRVATPENALSPGFCHRYAPRPELTDALESDAVTYFKRARTLPDDWCGEAQPARIPYERQISEDDREDAKRVLEYVKAYPALFLNEGAQRVVINMLKDRFGL